CCCICHRPPRHTLFPYTTLFRSELEPEFLSDRLRGRCGFARVHCKTNRMLGGLRTEDDVHFMRRQGPEQPFGGPAVADLAASSQREEGQVAHRADADRKSVV